VSCTCARTSFLRSQHSQVLQAGQALERPVGNRGDLVVVDKQDLQAGQASKGDWSNRRQAIVVQAPVCTVFAKRTFGLDM
jgi:hypothetical protein